MTRLALLLVAIALVAYGGDELYHATRNRAPVAMGCGELLQTRPEARWVRATGCEIDYMGATWRERRGRIRELFFPVRLSGPQPSEPIAVVAATTDPEALAVAQGIVGDQRRADQEAFTVMGLRIVTLLKASREVQGYARHGAIERALARRALSGLAAPLAPDFVVIDLNVQPGLVFPALVMALGATAFVGFVLAGRRRRDARVATQPAVPAEATAEAPLTPAVPAAIEPIEPPVPVTAVAVLAAADEAAPDARPAAEEAPPVETPPLEPPLRAPEPEAPPAFPGAVPHLRLPAMMLLNLPPSAGIDAIEHAPPLGSRAEVADRIGRALPGIHFDDSGRATWHGRDWSLAIGLGSHQPVWTVTVEAHGTAAAEAARQLATRTGWRVYVPKQGSFILDERMAER